MQHVAVTSMPAWSLLCEADVLPRPRAGQPQGADDSTSVAPDAWEVLLVGDA